MTSSPHIRPFPWSSIDTTTRAEERVWRAARRWGTRHFNVAGIQGAFAELLGTEVEILLRRARPFAAGGVVAGGAVVDGVGVVLARADAAQSDVGALLEVEHALAAQVVSRAVRRAPSTVVRPTARPPPAMAGAFAAVVMAVVRRAHAGVAMRIVDAGVASMLEGAMAHAQPDLIAISITVLLARDAFAARIVVARGALICASESLWSHETLATLGDTPLALPLVACATRMTAAELAELRRGDVLVPSPWPLSRKIDGSFVGLVWLAAPASTLAHRAEIVEDGRLVLKGDAKPIDPAEASMDANERAALVASIGEIPVIVRVELGEAVMTAREWAAISPGDVVALGRRIGETVVLRVGGLPAARGELVDIEGEVGVRITERALGPATMP